MDSAAGPVTTVLPPGRLDDEPLTWPRPLSRYGADDAAWWHEPVAVSRADRAALTSDNGPWKVSRVRPGGRSASVIWRHAIPTLGFPHLN